MKRILVTGATGFIGRHVLAPLVDRGFEVHGLGRRIFAAPGVHAHAGDLMDSAAIVALVQGTRPNHLLHLAWDAEPGEFWTTPRNLDWVAASLHLYRVFVDNGGRRAVWAGSCAEYDWNHSLLDEAKTPCVPGTLYGIAKHGLHTMIAEAARLDEVSLAWGRVFFLYGPGEKPGRLVSDIVAGLLGDRPVETTAGTQIRDFMHVADVAGAFAALCDSDVQGSINLASGDAHALSELMDKVAALVGRPDLLRLGARRTPPSEPHRLVASVTRLRSEVGFQAAFDLEGGLRDTISWWRGRLISERDRQAAPDDQS